MVIEKLTITLLIFTFKDQLNHIRIVASKKDILEDLTVKSVFENPGRR